MKKYITVLVLIISSVVIASAANVGYEAREKNGVQIRQVINSELRRHHHNNRNERVFYETRNVWKGNKEYRDTYKITIKNGKRSEKRVSHKRIN